MSKARKPPPRLEDADTAEYPEIADFADLKRAAKKAERAAVVDELVELEKWIASNVDLRTDDQLVVDPAAVTGRRISSHILARIDALTNDEGAGE